MTRTRALMMVGLLSAFALLVADVASAQQPGGGRQGRQGGRPGGGGGFGGFGGLGGGGGRGGQFDTFSLLRMGAIRTEIELEESQVEEIEEVQDKMREEIREVTAKITSKYEEELEEVLLPHQAERVQEISIQLRGLDALNDDKVIEDLKISDAQQKRMEETREEFTAKMREAFGGGGGGGGFNREAFDKIREIREERDAAVLAVLTKRQQDDFEKMKGKPFDRESLFQRRGGGGPGGGRRPGGDNGGGNRPARPDTE